MTSESRSGQLKSLFQQDKAMEQSKRRSPLTAVAAPAAVVPGGPHTPVSNEAAREKMAASSAPAFGAKGKPKGKTIEVQLAAKVQREAAPVPAPAAEAMRLDAYWGSYGDAGTRALLRSRKDQADTESILEVVIGADDRIEVGHTQDYPWRCIASLLITAADGTGWIGTGWLVGPRILLTAGHCVYMTDHGGWAESIEVIPGRLASERPFESCIATAFRSTQGWIGDGDREYDYAAILLPESCRYGDNLGWFGYEVWSDDRLQSLPVNISGYPGDKPDGTQWWHANTITEVSESVLTYEVDTAGGQSGAPVWIRKQDGGRFGLGIHTNGALTGNSATRIIQQVFDNISNWKAEVP